MGQTNVVGPVTTINQASVAANVTGPTIDTRNMWYLGFVFNMTGTLTAGYSLQCSNDGVTWANIAWSVAPTNAAGTSAITAAYMNIWPFNYARIFINYTSGTATTLTVTYVGKSQ